MPAAFSIARRTTGRPGGDIAPRLRLFSVAFVALNAACALTRVVGQTASAVPADYASYAAEHRGDADRGQKLFADGGRALCSTCHSVDRTHRGAGPDLFAIGDKFDRAGLIRAVLEPSRDIAVGYGATVVLTVDGLSHVGVVQRATDDWIELIDDQGKTIRVPHEEIDESFPRDTSLMPEGLQSNLSVEEFADLIAYLQSLRQADDEAAAGARTEIPPAATPVELTSLFDDGVQIELPTWCGQVPDHPGWFLALEQFGKSWLIERRADGDRQQPFLDLSEKVRRGGATGLLGFAFHPQFPADRRYFVKYQRVENGQLVTVVEQGLFAEDALAESGQARKLLLDMPGVTQDHNGGCLEFGPDGMLYVGMGDTGPQRDPRGHGQNLDTLLGKILRIDVDGATGDRPYAVPADNPFVGRQGARPEIWAYGFREPWRFTFDRATGELWVGDVGQDQYEEVDLVGGGENQGWNVFEGHAPFSDQYRREGEVYVSPVLSYSRRLGVSVTGGYVYRGARAQSMVGWYVFADFESRRIWAMPARRDGGAEAIEIGRCESRVSSFMQDLAGELYAVGFDSGKIYHLDLATVDRRPLAMIAMADTAEQGAVLWRYTQDAPEEDWPAIDYDDADWRLAPGGFGTAGTPGAVVRTDWRTDDVWLRREFTLAADVDQRSRLFLRLHHDEEAVVYLNGREICSVGGWTSGYQDIPLDETARRQLRAGRNVLAVHCRQHGGGQYIDAGIVSYETAQ
ncbi:MAG: PQQ-dependent sugar dehydrogenase [Planctomycetales bacterium]|nr:PQQ-dependent sugar dehydrogenase [Planctomycetales bacterium]